MSTTAFSTEKELIKTCSTILSQPEETVTVDTQIKIFKEGNLLSATIAQKSSEGQESSFSDEAQITELTVQSDLIADIEQDLEKLNLAERLIVHALTLTEDPVFKNAFNAGLDLRKVRSAKVYTIGKPTHMGLTAIVEAKDESGKDLGSFFGGFLVSACKR